MTPFESIGPILDLIGKLSATSVRVSKNARIGAAYLGMGFAAAVANTFRLGVAKPLSELRDCKLKKMQAIDLAEAAEAHNKALLTRKQAEDTEANAELKRSEARVNDAKARAIDGALELKRLELEREAAQERRLSAEARLERAAAKLRAMGGELYLEPPEEDGEQGGSDTDPPD